MSGPRIAYTLGMSKPHSHLFEVTVTVDGWSEPTLELVMPSWTPGSYMIREYARHVQDFTVEADGKVARWKKTVKDTGPFISVDGSQFPIADRQIAVTTQMRLVDHDVERAIHRLELILAIFNLHRCEHVVAVIIDVAASFPEI